MNMFTFDFGDFVGLSTVYPQSLIPVIHQGYFKSKFSTNFSFQRKWSSLVPGGMLLNVNKS